MADFVCVRALRQIDAQIFEITWTDERKDFFSLEQLQKNCPCRACSSEEKLVDPDLSAKKIMNVGRYALRIDFTSGCSKGIYTFAFLRSLSDGEE